LVPADLNGYFAASATAAAALIGLLFVAVTIRPEGVFGTGSDSRSNALATSSFIAFANSFFVSLWALIPKVNLGVIAVIFGLVALSSTVRFHRRDLFDPRNLALMAGSSLIYLVQLGFGIAAIARPHWGFGVRSLAHVTVGAYVIGLFRAWELLHTTVPGTQPGALAKPSVDGPAVEAP
jgi:hypothetical protein